MALSSIFLWGLVAISAALVEMSDAACEDIKPPGNFTNNMILGKRYLASYKKVFKFPEFENKCNMVYSHNNATHWQFVSIYEYSNQTDELNEYYGKIDGSGNFKVTNRPQTDGTKVSYTLSVLVGRANTYAFFYTCNKKSGEYGYMLLYKDRLQSTKSLPDKIKYEIIDAIASYNLDPNGLVDADNSNCFNR